MNGLATATSASGHAMSGAAMSERIPDRHVVLLGIGHTNAHIVRMWGMNPIPNASLTCISDRTIATYSGRLPAVLAGHIPREAMEIDLVRLCSSVGARLVTNTVKGLDLPRQLVEFEDRPAIPFDVLSIGVGSVPTTKGVDVSGSTLLKIKPMQTFLERLESALERAANKAAEQARPIKIVTVGSGAAGIEITFCLRSHLQKRGLRDCSLRIVTRSDEILPGVIPSMRKRVNEELANSNIAVDTGRRVVSVSDGGLQLNNGEVIDADLIIWATGASPPPLLSQLQLPLDERGFLATDETLRSTSRRPIFAVGDTGTIVSEHLPKAGVYAVRQGPILWNNIRATLSNDTLETYAPQKSFLKLLNTGTGRAIGEWKGFSFSGRWVMALKERIDGRFMDMYQVSDDMMSPSDAMPCKGCGCKLGNTVLDAALTSDSTTAIVAADQLDDAAVIDTPGGRVIASTDFFTTPFDDAYLSGRIAALHSASDLIAMGSSISAALANVVLPEGSPDNQRRMLNDLLEGAGEEFRAMGAEIVGGHTIVGPRCEVGFTVIGGSPAADEQILRKRHLQNGDHLIITKPLGIGVLLAAHMRSQVRAAHFESLLAAMLQRQHAAPSVLTELGVTAATDITGFGLAGHLLEMLSASNVGAEIQLDSIPLLPGAADAFNAGIESTLAPDNRSVEKAVSSTADQQVRPEYHALFDPQTCGGLLLGVSLAASEALHARLRDEGIDAVTIGTVTQAAATPIVLQ